MTSPLDSIGGQFVRPDLTYFEPVNEVSNARLSGSEPVTHRAQQAPARGAPVRTVGRSPATGPSRAVATRPAHGTPRGVVKPVVTTQTLATTKATLQVRPQQKTARPVVTHEVRSARVEKAQVNNCKERPSTNKAKGGGSGKDFVPWCSRKR